MTGFHFLGELTL